MLWIPAFSRVPCRYHQRLSRLAAETLLQSSNQFLAVLKHFLCLGLKLCISACFALLVESNPQQQRAESEAKLTALGHMGCIAHTIYNHKGGCEEGQCLGKLNVQRPPSRASKGKERSWALRPKLSRMLQQRAFTAKPVSVLCRLLTPRSLHGGGGFLPGATYEHRPEPHRPPAQGELRSARAASSQVSPSSQTPGDLQLFPR